MTTDYCIYCIHTCTLTHIHTPCLGVHHPQEREKERKMLYALECIDTCTRTQIHAHILIYTHPALVFIILRRGRERRRGR